jgi:CheY-like chemotaxis protein
MTAHHPVILIVEDEALVRLSAVGMLEDAGFRMIEAVNGDEALELLEADSDVQLLFTDINMPGAINGLALVKVRGAKLGAISQSACGAAVADEWRQGRDS